MIEKRLMTMMMIIARRMWWFLLNAAKRCSWGVFSLSHSDLYPRIAPARALDCGVRGVGNLGKSQRLRLRAQVLRRSARARSGALLTLLAGGRAGLAVLVAQASRIERKKRLRELRDKPSRGRHFSGELEIDRQIEREREIGVRADQRDRERRENPVGRARFFSVQARRRRRQQQARLCGLHDDHADGANDDDDDDGDGYDDGTSGSFMVKLSTRVGGRTKAVSMIINRARPLNVKRVAVSRKF